MAEKWVKEARGEAKNEAHLRHEVKKALGAAREENNGLLTKLTTEEGNGSLLRRG